MTNGRILFVLLLAIGSFAVHAHAGSTYSYAGRSHYGLQRSSGTGIVPTQLVTGTVKDTDTTLGRFTVQDDQGNTMEFAVNSKIPIMKDGVQGSFLDILPGDKITVCYTCVGIRPRITQIIDVSP